MPDTAESQTLNQRQSPVSELPLKTFLSSCEAKFSGLTEGAVADYIPELSKVDPAYFGIAVTTVDGHTHEVGDSQIAFTIQSVSKAFVYALAIEFCGHEDVASTIGVEPSGEAFNSIRLTVDNRPFNPMVNAGAIACSGLIHRKDPDSAFERIRDILSRFAGRNLTVDEDVYRSESETGDRNRAIAWLLKNNNILKSDVDRALDVYFRQCALLVTARDLSIMGATLANNGINPVTGTQVIGPLTAARTLSVMVSSGMYDYSGEWIYRVGLPAKSGVGGGIVAALPAQIGLGTFSPNLDQLGNSLRGIKVCEEFSTHFGLHLLERQGDVKSSVAAAYTVADVHSQRDRRVIDKEIIERHGDSVHVIELAGALNFVACDYISRQIFGTRLPDIEIFDFRRVSGLSSASAKMLGTMFLRLAENGSRVVITGLKNGTFPARVLSEYLPGTAESSIRRFSSLNDGVAWAEDQLVYVHGGFSNIFESTPLSDQPLLKGLRPEQLNQLTSILAQQEYAGGSAIVRSGEKSDSIYFLTKGMVSVVLQSGVRVATLDAGTCFGEFSLLDHEQTRSADVIADSVCRCLKMTIADLKRLAMEEPDIYATILKNLSILLADRLRLANQKIDALAV